MKLIVLGLIFIATSLTAMSQGSWYNLQPNDTIVATAEFNNLNIYDIYQVNNQSNSIILKWQFISSDITSGWEYTMCDNNACYPGIPDSGTMNTIDPAESGLLGFSVIPDTIVGHAFVRMHVYDEQHPNEGDTLTWLITTPLIYNSLAELAENTINVYPSVCNNFVSITSIARMEQIDIVNELGVIVLKKHVTANTCTVDVSGLPAGLYRLTINSKTAARISRSILVVK